MQQNITAIESEGLFYTIKYHAEDLFIDICIIIDETILSNMLGWTRFCTIDMQYLLAGPCPEIKDF